MEEKTNPVPSRETIVHDLKSLQDEICDGLEVLDGRGRFREDAWSRSEGGGGRTRILQGAVIEKGGVAFSHVHGDLPAPLRSPKRHAKTFHAAGVSIVLHPKNPYVPIIHMNVRYFEMDNGEYWFGGGIDLTPAYVFEEDGRFFHERLKSICDSVDPAFYEAHKRWSDEYFTIKHRNEMRGIGGVFFDDLVAGKDIASNRTRQELFGYLLKLGKAFVPIYSAIVLRHKDRPYGEREKVWQSIRRGRYVEFNLVYDRGTQFGLQSGGRTESILMSMPPMAEWRYDHHPEPGSFEQKSLEYFQPRKWV